MSEEIKRLSAFEAFQQTQQTYLEAEEKAKKEAGAPKVERFRIDGDGEYSIRILPLAPVFDEDGNIKPMERKGYEYPLRQLWLKIKTPAKKGGKPGKINVPVIRATEEYVGKSVDLIDTYVKIAREMYSDDEELLKVVNGNSFGGGLRWDFLHPIYVLDVSSDKERAKGPQLWYAPNGRYKDIDGARIRLWRELLEDDPKAGCPIAGITNSYPVKVIRTTDKKTEYTVEIGRKKCDITEEEVQKLLDLPRIPDLIYRYTRRQMEATLAFLKQYDAEHDMKVCDEPDFQEAVEKLTGELSPEDTSHFDLNNAEAKTASSKADTIESLWAEYDSIIDQELTEKSDEYQELREKIRQFIEDNDLDVRISRTKNNQQLLDEIEEALAEKKPEVSVAVPEQEEVEEEEEKIEEETEPDPVSTPRPRRPRPTAVSEPKSEQEDEEEEAVQEPEPKTEEPSRRRLHRRLR